MSRKRILTVSAIALTCFCALVALDLLAPFAYVSLRNTVRDAITRAGRTTPANPDLVFLAIDRESVSLQDGIDIEELFAVTEADATEMRALRAMSHLFPWPREIYALVVERLVQAGAKVVMFDLTFPTPTNGDEPFQLALERYGDHVVLGSNFINEESLLDQTKRASLTRPTESLIPQTAPMDDRVAYTNFWADEDAVVRRARFHITLEEANERPPGADSERFLSLGARALVKAGFQKRVPAGTENRLFRYTAPPRMGFRPRSLFEIFVPEYWKRNYGSGEFFRDKIVIVGAEGNWQHDEHATPFGSMPGPELHLNAINAALQGEFISEVSHLTRLLVTLAAACLAVALSLSIRSPWLRLIALVVINCLDVWATLLAFDHLSMYMPCLPVLIEFNVTVLLSLVCDFTWERVEKNRVRRTLEKYVSTNVVRELLDNPVAFQHSLGGVIKPVAILFSDIRGYSIVSANTDPHALVSQLNEYLGAMVECVFRHGGTLDKFIGDAVMAVWGNVRSDGTRTDATNAVRAALEMRTELARLNADWQKRSLPELRIGIAVNQGDVVVGNVGSPRRMEFTVIGDAVNISWKLQELTKQYDADVIVSRAVHAAVVEDFELQSLGAAQVAGRTEPMEIFSVLGPVEVAPAEARRTDAGRSLVS